jgi:two-component system sensor histidine kinase/response regulator
VDDEAAQMTALCHTLEDHGYATTGFSSANAALAELKKTEFDLLLSDLMMPEMDGITLLQAGLKINPNLVGIIMTGEGTIATAVEAMKSGALDYILKPFKLSAILPVLARALSVRQLRLENAALTRSVRERTAQLEAANRELEAFSYSVSHDLRAPLRSIGGFSAMLLRGSANLSEQDRQWLNRVCDSAKTMGNLIDGLLDLSRMSRQPLSKRTLNVKELVRQSFDELPQEPVGRQVEFRMGDLPDCSADFTLFKQVWVNLLSNAFKYTRQKEKAVIEVDWQPQEQEIIYFVRDNGAGFDMHYAHKLFGVFQRLHGNDQFEGTGVGLSIVQRILHRHGGRIWAEAGVNQGATFYFSMPKDGRPGE